MLTQDKTITTPEYWDKIYSGNNDNAKVDASNTKRTSTFDRFQIVVEQAEGTKILGVGSGHARIESTLKNLYPEWEVIASDQSIEAKNVSKYEPYIIADAYSLPFPAKYFDTVIATQMLEYLEFPDKFLNECKRISNKFLCTLPKGIMKSWSQLREYNIVDTREFFEQCGKIELFEVYADIMLLKVKFK